MIFSIYRKRTLLEDKDGYSLPIGSVTVLGSSDSGLIGVTLLGVESIIEDQKHLIQYVYDHLIDTVIVDEDGLIVLVISGYNRIDWSMLGITLSLIQGASKPIWAVSSANSITTIDL